METLTDIAIDDCFVIHMLDHRLAAPQCSQILTTLPDKFRTVIMQYILSLLKPGFRRKQYGRFQPESTVLRLYQRIVASGNGSRQVDPDVFLRASQEIATSLFQAMRPQPRNGSRVRPGEITPGDLLVGLFHGRAPEAPAGPYLFLIKVDLETAMQRQVRPLGTGGIQTVLTPREGLIPKLTAVHIHKSALVQYTNDSSTFDVIMTDPQGGKQGIAKFFAQDFLQTEPFQTATQQAELLFMRTHAWVTEREDVLSPREQQEVLESVRTLLTARAANAEPLAPRDLVVTMPLTEPRASQMEHELRQSFQETLTAPEENGNSIPPDRELFVHAVPERVAKTRIIYELDDGVQLRGDREAIVRLFVNPPRRVGNNTEFTIRTATFRPVL